ncbi:MAG TPA: outer membrane lipoprotein carrier protein LolA [Candidatus Acidoferrum sp.]|nr:outer membrane lipoprotein carrier protein LolA [Candidatus Acidoferrum sp.]
MSRWVTLAAALLFAWAPLRPGEAAPAESPILGTERAEVIESVQAKQRSVTSVRATVIQKKRHPLLAAEATSQGTLLFKRPGLVRWEVTKPDRTIILIDDRTLLTYHPDRQEAERRDLRDDFGARAAVEFFTAGMSLAVADLEKRFQVELYRESQALVVKLTPRSRFVAQAVASITLTQHAEDALPRQIVIVGQKGDRTELTLRNVIINPQLPEDAFSLRLGPEVRVTDVGTFASERGSDR